MRESIFSLLRNCQSYSTVCIPAWLKIATHIFFLFWISIDRENTIEQLTRI